MRSPVSVSPPPIINAGQWLSKHASIYLILKQAVKGKYTISSSQNFLYILSGVVI
jgi:hypothetical protein